MKVKDKKTVGRRKIHPVVAKVVAGAVVRNAKVRARVKQVEKNPYSEIFRLLGAKGGAAKTVRKVISARENLKKALAKRWAGHKAVRK